MTKQTDNFNLGLYEDTDKPNLRDQYNSSMYKIDAALEEQVVKHNSQNTIIEQLQNQVNGFDESIATKAPIMHTSADATYGAATEDLYGHVKITNNSATGSDSAVITNKALKQALTGFTPTGGGTILACIGDSFLEGYCPDGNTTPWGTLIANALGVTPHNYALGGTGFVNAVSNTTFNTLVNNAYSGTPDANLVIIGGGYNDSKSDVSTLYTNALSTLQNCRSKFPGATIWVFPNLWGCSNYGVESEEHANAIINACKDMADSKIRFIGGCWTWLFDNTAYVGSDKLHPKQQGQNRIAASMLCAMGGGDPTIYAAKVSASNGTVLRNYLVLSITIQGISGSINDTVCTMSDNFNMYFTVGMGMGTISGSYSPVYYTAENNTVKIFYATGHVDANGYVNFNCPMVQG